MLTGAARLLAANRAYRRLWAAQAVSLIGDWFTFIALAAVVARATQGSGVAVAGLVLCQILPYAVIGPWAGVLADRFDRRKLLIASDLTRVFLVLALIPAIRSGELAVVYALATVHYTMSTVFEPARSALIPRIVRPADLVTATTVSSLTWSVMAAVGGALGGTLLALVGPVAAFALDAGSFLASALLLRGLPPVVPGAAETLADEPRSVVSPIQGAGFADGLRHLASHPVTGAIILIKTSNGLAIVDTFLVVFATRVFPRGEGGAISLGWLWACFGLGALVGPPLLNMVNDGSVRRMRRLVTVGMGSMAIGLLVLAASPSLWLAGVAIVVRGIGGSINWTYSTLLLQKTVPDRYRGRIFAIDLANAMIAASSSSLVGGWFMDRAAVRAVALVAGAVALLPLVAWILAIPWMDRRDAEGRGENA